MTPSGLDISGQWLAEALEREARAANPDVVGFIERDVEQAIVRTLRRCADELLPVLAELAETRRRLDDYIDSAELACESPPSGCDCPGCSEARRRACLDP